MIGAVRNRRAAWVLALSSVFATAGCNTAVTPSPDSSTAAAACPVTIANSSVPPGANPAPGQHGNGKLWTGLWPGGIVIVDPRWVQSDGSINLKWWWWRSHEAAGTLRIAGRRLDARTTPLTGEIPDGYGLEGFQASSIIFPNPGCWEVTGSSGGAALTFVTLVQMPLPFLEPTASAPA